MNKFNYKEFQNLKVEAKSKVIINPKVFIKKICKKAYNKNK